MTTSSHLRRVLVLTHTGRAAARDVARACITALMAHGVAVRLLEDEAADLDMSARREDPLTAKTATPKRSSA